VPPDDDVKGTDQTQPDPPPKIPPQAPAPKVPPQAPPPKDDKGEQEVRRGESSGKRKLPKQATEPGDDDGDDRVYDD